MYQCIDVRGYIALFNVVESSKEFQLCKRTALDLLERNKNKTIPLVISHIGFYVDLTIGSITRLTIDNKGIYCVGIINNSAFLKVQYELNETFIKYFTKVTPSPYLFVQSCLSCFSLSHNKNDLSIQHVALVDVGARRGTLVKYTSNSLNKSFDYSSSENDFYNLLCCYTKNTLKLADKRNNLLFQDVLLSNEHDTEFISAGEKKTICTERFDELLNSTNKSINTMYSNNLASNQSSSNNINSETILQMIGHLVSNSGKRKLDDYETPVPKNARSAEDQVITAAQTLISDESVKKSTSELSEFKRELKNEMQQQQAEFIAQQTNMLKEIMNQPRQAPLYANPYQFYPPMQGPPSYQSYIQPSENTKLPNDNRQIDSARVPISNNINGPSSTTSTQPMIIEPTEQTIIRDEKSSEKTNKITDMTNTCNDTKSSEDVLIQAGMTINEKDHLINELFRQFIEKTFVINRIEK